MQPPWSPVGKFGFKTGFFHNNPTYVGQDLPSKEYFQSKKSLTDGRRSAPLLRTLKYSNSLIDDEGNDVYRESISRASFTKEHSLYKVIGETEKKDEKLFPTGFASNYKGFIKPKTPPPNERPHTSVLRRLKKSHPVEAENDGTVCDSFV